MNDIWHVQFSAKDFNAGTQFLVRNLSTRLPHRWLLSVLSGSYSLLATRRRARAMMSGFEPRYARDILAGRDKVGFVAIKPDAQGLRLDHLYFHPSYQGSGIEPAVAWNK